jgi:tape measure domain-containing protein
MEGGYNNMSTTIDQKVVEMRFDNSNFERNVSTTMSSLDKLKQKLNFAGASKSLENVGAAAKGVDMGPLSNGVQAVHAKFSALEIMGITALTNITNTAVNAGKRIVSALTIDPVKTGFGEYELKMDSIKTIMASTGESVETVNKYLNELNEYSDQTIYSFADMTQNIGKFTNAGVKLEDAVMAIKGISNEAAVSGANANEASRAMYNFAQALSAGYVKLIDWKSIELANMATKEFKEQLIETAVETGTLTKSADGMYKTLDGSVLNATKNFNESLQDQWMTTDVLVKTLGKYANAETEIGKKAFAAAQEVTKLSQMFDVLKETAQSGWARTWELIFGNILEAKAVFTPLTNFFSKILDTISDARNNLLEGALTLTKPFKALSDRIESVTKVTETVTEALKDYDAIVDRIISGEFGYGQSRWDKLSEMGYDWAHAQNLVNEKLGDSYRHQTDYTEAVKDTNKAQGVTLEQLMKLSDAELENIGFTKDEIEAFRELAKYAERTGIPIEELTKDLDKLSGRSLLINSFKNIGNGLVSVFNSLKTAWQDIFPPKSMEERSEALYNLIAALHKFSLRFALTEEQVKEQLKDGDSTLGKLVRTFKGLFAIVDVITTVVGGGFKAAFKVVTTLLGYFNMDVLDLTARIGDLLVRFRDWVDEHNLLVKAIEWLAPYLEKVVKAISKFIKHIKEAGYIKRFTEWLKQAAKAVGDWFDKIKDSKQIQGFINYLKKSATAIKNWVKGIKEAENIPKYILSGLVNGLKTGAKDAWNTIKDIGLKLIEKIKDVLGIHSPSTVFFAIGGFIMAGLLLGLQNGASGVWDYIRDFGAKCIEVIKGIDIGGLIAAAITAGVVTGFVKISGAIHNFSLMFKGVGQMLEGLGDMLEGVGKGVRNWLNSAALINFAIAIGILAVSLALLSLIPTDKLWSAFGIIAAMTVLLAGLITLIGFFGRVKVDGKVTKISLEIGKFAMLFASMSLSILLMAASLMILGKMNMTELAKGAGAIVVIAGVMVGLMAATRLLSKSVKTTVNGSSSTGIDDELNTVGNMLLKMAVALLLIAVVVKMLGKMNGTDLAKGVGAITGFVAMIVVLMAATRALATNYSTLSVDGMLLKLGASLLLMAIAVKILGGMDTKSLVKGIVTISLFGVMIVALMWATNLFTKDATNADKIGTTLLGIGGALLMMAVAVRILGKMDIADLAKGIVAMVLLGGVIVGLMAATKLVGTNNINKIGVVLIEVAAAIAIMALTTTILGLLSVEALLKGIVAIAAFSGIIVGLMAATKLVEGKGINKIGKTLILTSVAIGILALVAALLGLVKLENLAKGVVAVGLLSGIMILLMKTTSGIKTGVGQLIVMSVAIAVLAASAVALSLVDTAKLLVATAAIAVLLGMFRVLLEAKSNIQSSLGTLIVMTVVIAVLAAVVLMLGQLAPESAISSTIALSTLMIAMAAVLKIISSMNLEKQAVKLLAGMAGLAALAGVMWLFIQVLKTMEGMDNAMNNVLVMSSLMLAMSAVLAIVAATGVLGAAGLIPGVIGLTVLVGEMWLFIQVLKTMEGMENATTNATAISKLMFVMSEVLAITAAVGTLYMATFGISGVLGLVGLAALIPIISDLIDELKTVEAGAFTEAQLNTVIFAAEALKVLAKASKDIPNSGGLLGALVGNNDLGDFASQFPELGKGIRGFLDEVGTFTEAEVATINCAAKAVKTLAEAASSIDGQANWTKNIIGDNSLTAFADQFPALGVGIRAFIAAVGAVDDSQIQTINCALQVIKDLAEVSNSIEGQSPFGKWLTGDNSLSTFAEQFPALGTGLRGFLDNVGSFTEDGLNAVKAAATAVKELAKVSKDIPNSGGWFGGIAGENDLSTFAAQFPYLGIGLSVFINTIGTFTETELETVKVASKAVTEIAKASDAIPNSGGWFGAIVGDNNLGTFSAQFPLVGIGLRGFIDSIGTFTEAEVTTVKCASDAIVSIAKASENIDGQAEWTKKLFGDNSLSGLATHFGNLGSGIAAFAENLGTFDEAKVTTVKYAVKALNSITSLANTDIKSAKNNIPKFGDSIVELAKDVSTFCAKIPAYETVEAAMKGAKSVFTTMSGIVQADSAAMQTLGRSLKDLAKSGLDSFIKGFTEGSAQSAVKKAGKTMVETFVDGMKDKTSDVEKASENIAKDGAESARDEKSEFESAGSDLVEGFASGISLNTYIATRAARAMAAAAAAAAEDELDINSPSKVFRAIGYSVPEGFAAGISKYSDLVENSTVEMAKSGIDGVKDSISRIADVINSDMDSQPTIRPVLDLSDVRSNAGLIGALLGADVGVLANVGSINSMMNRRIQNGTNLDIIAAINKLRKDIGNINNTSYTINGVTYDDGSNIADAVESIVRAARVERRR